MTPYTFVHDVEAEVPIPQGGILSRTLFHDDSIKITAFAFSAGHVMTPHSTPMAAALHFVKGEAELTLGEERKTVAAGSLVHMVPGLPHGITAKTALVMVLYTFKPHA